MRNPKSMISFKLLLVELTYFMKSIALPSIPYDFAQFININNWQKCLIFVLRPTYKVVRDQRYSPSQNSRREVKSLNFELSLFRHSYQGNSGKPSLMGNAPVIKRCGFSIAFFNNKYSILEGYMIIISQ